ALRPNSESTSSFVTLHELNLKTALTHLASLCCEHKGDAYRRYEYLLALTITTARAELRVSLTVQDCYGISHLQVL
ncbi:unnamed protein product, partial [Gulo gulo]